MNVGEPARRNDQTAIRRTREVRNCRLDLGGVAQVDLNDLHSERRRDGLNDTELGRTARYAGISKHRHSRQGWYDLLEQFEPFSTQTVFKVHKAGHIAARSRQTVDEAGTDRVRNHCEYDRYRASRL